MTGKEAVDEVFDVVGPIPEKDARGVEADAPGVEADPAELTTIVLRVHVNPGAGRTAVVGRHGDAVKLRVAAPPEGGRANEAVAGLLATTLGVPRERVSLTSGQKSRSKRFRVEEVDLDAVRRLLTEAMAGDTGGNARGRRGVR
jgi:uncharacterized protein